MKNTGIISQMSKDKMILLNEKYLNSKCLKLGYSIHVVESIESTNTKLKNDLESLPHKTVLIAEEQTFGRGRQNRQFISNKSKGIFCSLVWKLKFDPKQVQWFSLMTSVALVEALINKTNLKFQIKWPNDILLNQKKCAGILMESEISPDHQEISIVCGFGINVYHQDFADELKEKVISIEDAYPFALDRNEIIIEILKQLDFYQTCPFNEQSKENYNNYLYIPEHFVNIQHQKQLYKAKLLGIDDEGYMQAVKENGETICLTVEEIHFV